MTTSRFGWILVGWLAVFGLAQAAMYKWVDENGVTQYSQYPPPGRDYQTVTPPPAPAEDPEGAQQRLEQLLQKQDEAYKAKTEAAAQEQKSAETAKRREQNCQAARQNLERLTTGGNRRIVGPDGVAYYPTEEERQERIAKARQQIEEFCD
ncbi:MAG: DUF4124 domain-containing protein [Gammaproteobacteria bacterium]